MNIIHNLVKLCIAGMILLHLCYIYLLINVDIKGECVSNGKQIYRCVLIILFISLLLMVRMFIGVLTHRYDEIDWNYNFFQLADNDSNRYYIMCTFYLVEILFGFLGVSSIKCIWNYFEFSDDKCYYINEYIGIGLFPFFLVSIYNYYKLCVGFILGIALIIIPKTMFHYFDSLLENKSKITTKVFIGNTPECCVCYEENCWINRCGHLICKNCIEQIKSLKCPLCQGNIDLVQSYLTYKKNQ